MTTASGGSAVPVLLDTDVFSHIYVSSPRSQQGVTWVGLLTGRTVAIAVQTEVELRVWPSLQSWGERRTAELVARIESVARIQVSELVQQEYVRLTVWAKQQGHAIQDKIHTGDRWVAATALAHGLELAAIDDGYDGIDGLNLLKP